MRPLRRSFLLAFFTLAVCRRHSTNTSSTFSPLSPALILPTPDSQGSSPPSQSFSSSSSNTFSPSPTTSSTLSSTSTITLGPPATPTTSSSRATSSTTSTDTSTTSPSTTSTSTSSSSSQTSSPSSSTSLSPTTSDVTPATTLIVPGPDFLTTSTSSSDDPGPTTDVSSSPATSSTSFWDNKSAVAGVFVTAVLAALVLVAVVAYKVFRRRQQRKLELAMEAEDFVDRGDIEDPYDTRGASPTASMTQLTTPNRVEAFVSRDIHFGANSIEFAGQGNYGLDYPPVAVPLNNAGRAPMNPAAGNVRHQLSVGTSAAGFLAPPSNSRQTPGRESVATQISYDSFYGGIDRGCGQAI